MNTDRLILVACTTAGTNCTQDLTIIALDQYSAGLRQELSVRG